MTDIAMSEDLKALLDQPNAFGRVAKPVSEAEFDAFEAGEGHALPQDYKAFCLRYGERELNNKAIFSFQAEAAFPNGETRTANVGLIAGPASALEARARYMDPLYNNSGPRLPAHFYPFTFDSGYGHCLLDLSADTHGRILHMEIKTETFGAPGYGWEQVGVVADSFPAFLAALVPDRL